MWIQGQCLLALLCASACASAAIERAPVELEVSEYQPEKPSEHPKVAPRPCDQIYITEYWLLDATRAQLEEKLCSAALWLDGLTGDDGNVLAARRTRGHAEVSYYHSDFAGPELRLRLRIRVELPVLRRRLSAFIGLENENDFIEGRSEGFALRSEFPSLESDNKWLAGLGYSFPGSEVFKSDFRVGARNLTNTEIFLQNRYRYLAYSDFNDVFMLRETFFWTNQDGFGATTGADWMHVLNKRYLTRWDNVATVSEESLGLDWRSAMLLYQELGNETGMAYQLFIRGETRHPVPVREYGVRAIYRRPLYGRRLYLQLITGYTWPKDDPTADREPSVGIGAGLELPFGPRDDADL